MLPGGHDGSGALGQPENAAQPGCGSFPGK